MAAHTPVEFLGLSAALALAAVAVALGKSGNTQMVFGADS
jgi:hypothetical protein